MGLIDYSLSQAKLLSSGEFYTSVNSNITIGKDTWRENILDAFTKMTIFEIIYRKVININQKQQIHNVVTFNLIKNQSYSYGTLIAPVVNLGMIKCIFTYHQKVLISNASIEDNFTAIQLSSLFLKQFK